MVPLLDIVVNAASIYIASFPSRLNCFHFLFVGRVESLRARLTYISDLVKVSTDKLDMIRLD